MTNLIFGKTVVKVEHLEILNNISQDLANAIATGPQDTFFDKLDNFNADLRHYGIDSLDVTNGWNWKPGTYPKIEALLNKKLTITKKAKDISHKIRRVKEYSNYLHYMIRQAEEMENLKYDLKSGGYSRNVDVDEFKEIANVFANTINEQADIAYDASNGKVEIKPFIKLSNNTRDSKIYLDVYIRNINLNVYNGKQNAKLIQTIPSEKDSFIRIIMYANLRQVINKMRKHYAMTGRFISHTKYLQHPYISQNNYNSDIYSSVCLSSYSDDIQNSLRNQDFMSLQHHLLSWAQYYHTQYSNPYNKPDRFHIGVPEYLSDEYKSTVSVDTGSCGNAMRNKYSVHKGMAGHLKLIRACDNIKCTVKEACFSYKASSKTYDIYKNTDIIYEVESMIGYIKSYIASFYLEPTYWTILDALHNASGDFGVRIQEKPPEMDDIDYLYKRFYFYLINNRTTFDYILEAFNYSKGCKEVKKECTDSIEEQMLKWATSSGRSE
jgi:hypothetical protein